MREIEELHARLAIPMRLALNEFMHLALDEIIRIALHLCTIGCPIVGETGVPARTRLRAERWNGPGCAHGR